jgi:hypothetical protein
MPVFTIGACRPYVGVMIIAGRFPLSGPLHGTNLFCMNGRCVPKLSSIFPAFLAVIVLCTPAANANAATEVSLWHSYTNQTGVVHFGFDLRKFKRGVFFGSCGPSTRSLQWEYGFDLKGNGPRFVKDDVELKDADFHPIPLASGNIVVDEKKSTIEITLQISTNGVAQSFVGNGTYRLRTDRKSVV